MPRRTEHTLTTPEELFADLERVRARGYALDDGEQELGVRCVALEVAGAPRPVALSMSGPLTRMSDDVIDRAVPDPARRRGADRPGARRSRYRGRAGRLSFAAGARGGLRRAVAWRRRRRRAHGAVSISPAPGKSETAAIARLTTPGGGITFLSA